MVIFFNYLVASRQIMNNRQSQLNTMKDSTNLATRAFSMFETEDA